MTILAITILLAAIIVGRSLSNVAATIEAAAFNTEDRLDAIAECLAWFRDFADDHEAGEVLELLRDKAS